MAPKGKTPLLDRVTSHFSAQSNTSSLSELRTLTREELKTLCQELREDLVQVISQCGGHFASSLGVVELTVALHAALETPHDRIVFDTGHQAYIHKILTGRRAALPSIRQLGGISGFLRREESEFDSFGAGHAGTSISAGAGMLEASSHSYPGSEERRVAVVIGDGSMTSGMAFEALNHMGQLHRNLIVVLNDNEMSIAPNVGALSWGFSRAVTGKFSTVARKHFKSLVEKGVIPHAFYRAIDKAEEATQGFLSTPGMLFSSFGFRYIGPVDGHNVDQLLDALGRAKEQDGPVLIHALTMKGKGYDPAEADPVKYHGVTPFLPEDGSFKKSNKLPSKSYTQIFGETLVELCRRDRRIVGITAAMPDGTGLKLLGKELPDRYFDVGIAEQHAVTFAAGMACEGMKPVVAIYSTFLQRGYDQVLHDVCIQNLPVIFAMDRAGLVGADGATHHGVFDISFLRSIPNIMIMAAKDEAELRDMLATGIAFDGPSAIRYPRGDALGVECSKEPTPLEIGRGEILRLSNTRPNAPLLIGIGNTVQFCEQAARILESDFNISCSVVNARFIKPLDRDLLAELIPEHRFVVTVEDHAITGGFGSAVLELCSDERIPVDLIRLGIPDRFIEHGSQAELYKLCGFDVEAIVSKVLSELGVQKPHPRTANA